MHCYPFHPPGLIVRKRPNRVHRFAVRDPGSGCEVHLGSDWAAAYRLWLEARASTTIVPKPTPVRWLITEFSERHRPWAEKECKIFEKEMRLLHDAVRNIGDPSITDLNAADCETFRATSCAGPVKTETLVRRLRQIWAWANTEGLAQTPCPWVAKTQESQLQAEVVEIVSRFLPPYIQRHLLFISSTSCIHKDGYVAMMPGPLSEAVQRGVETAIQRARLDGRSDLIPALSRCELPWFIDRKVMGPAPGQALAELLHGHARAQVVRKLRKKARTRHRVTPESDGSSQNIE